MIEQTILFFEHRPEMGMSRGTMSWRNFSGNMGWRPVVYFIQSEEQPVIHGPMNVMITIGPKTDAGECVPVVVLHPQSIPRVRRFFDKHGFDFKELSSNPLARESLVPDSFGI